MSDVNIKKDATVATVTTVVKEIKETMKVELDPELETPNAEYNLELKEEKKENVTQDVVNRYSKLKKKNLLLRKSMPKRFDSADYYCEASRLNDLRITKP